MVQELEKRTRIDVADVLRGLAVMGMLSLQGCNDDDDDLPNSKVPEAVRNAFDSSFSNTANLSWETKTVQGQYYKAEFNNKSDNGYKTEAWYTADGSWYMTETEMPYSDIPQAIKTSFESSEYASWKRDNEVERIERAGTEKEIIYIIEVEQFIGIDTHRRHPHTAALYGNRNALISAVRLLP